MLKELEGKHCKIIIENQRLTEKLQVQTSEFKEIMNAPKKEYTERITELESEIGDLKELIATFESSVSRKSPIKNQETTNELVEKLSVMLLLKLI